MATVAVAGQLGVVQRTVQRWLRGTASSKPAAAQGIADAVRVGWQPRVRQRVRRGVRGRPGDGGRRASGLDVEFTGIQWADFGVL
ncbi:hypothetical protein [Kitasatospora sp. DSM 101779]|uniref:hypothetical protein n=1 Tax=Kitasatospora sp. DSM 101779 TaxID=2853165 RepID=UPI0021D9FD9D|nr:hypothetical protein [Kitasatospora sp. DSM 101779]MCU7827162.1 hypothetical protein [Kitasatospora sp. DSM 101779]